MARRKAALPANEAASTTNAHPAPAVATSRPDRAGPATDAALLLTDSSEFAFCSFSGGRTWATSPSDAVCSTAVAIEMSTLATANSQICARLVSSRTATITSTASRRRSAPSMRSRRGSRSAHTPATW